MSAGRDHSLALREDGSIVPWGAPSSGAFLVPQDAMPAYAITAGSNFCAAATVDGRVVCWGSSPLAMMAPPELDDTLLVSAGLEHAMALRSDGSVVCWGDNSAGQCDVPRGLGQVVAVAAGSTHSMALREDGTAVAWGGNEFGQGRVPPYLKNLVRIAASRTLSMGLVGTGVPSILRQPFPRLGRDGRRVIQVLAVGAPPLSYAWTLDGVPVGSPQHSRLTVPASGRYAVTISGPSGSITSDAIDLQLPPVRLDLLAEGSQGGGDRLVIRVSGLAGRTGARLERSDDLKTWVAEMTLVPGAEPDALEVSIDLPAAPGQRFFRVTD